MDSTVFVGVTQPWPRSRRWPFDEVAHLFSEDLEALHRVAARIGMKRAWFQDKPGFPHYDLNGRKAKEALLHGAVAADRKTEVEFHRMMLAVNQARAVPDVAWAMVLEEEAIERMAVELEDGLAAGPDA